jgi:hypothetical protein
MEPSPPGGGFKSLPKGPVTLIIAASVVVGMAIAFPPYRLFILVSVGIGVVVAAILYLWHRFRPLKDEDINNKRPLGLG